MASNAIGLFRESDAALAAAGRLRREGFAGLEVISPIPLHGVEETLGKKKSVIKRFTLIGALVGGFAGFSLAAGTAVMYLHPTGGRPIIPVPPFLVITYEMIILCGILATVLGFLISARLPVVRERAHLTEVTVDKFAVSMACEDERGVQRASAILRETGAEQVTEGVTAAPSRKL